MTVTIEEDQINTPISSPGAFIRQCNYDAIFFIISIQFIAQVVTSDLAEFSSIECDLDFVVVFAHFLCL